MNIDFKPDDIVENLSRKLANHMSRRGFLAVLGKTALAFVVWGIAEILLPVDRTNQVAEASHTCSDWRNCDMHGYPCACCGGSSSSCPSGTQRGSFWTGCCAKPSGGCSLIYYYDCCGSTGCSNCEWCTNSNEGTWCGGVGGGYKCTLAIIGSSCGPC